MSSPTPVVCVVDDDRSVRRALSRLLRSCGVDALAFASARDLLSDERRRRAACFVIDVRMPEMDGFELAERLEADGTSAPVIFITAHLDETTRERARAAGARKLLDKPFDDHEILEALPEIVWSKSHEAEESKGPPIREAHS